jgi:AcrR family transcriptional regulator
LKNYSFTKASLAASRITNRTKQRQKILSAAARLFCRNGYLGTSIEEIANTARVNKASIYYYYKNKSYLLFEVVTDHLQGMLDMAMQIVQADFEPTARLEALVKGHIRWQATHLETAGIGHVERKNLPTKLRQEYISLRDEYESIFRKTIEDGMSRGDFSVTDAKLTTLLILGLTASVNQWYQPKGRLSADEIAAKASAFISKALGAGPII